MGEEIQKCPRCGRPFKALIPGVGRQFECATIVLPVGGHAEGMPCVMRQRDQLATEIQTLRTANAALVERVKRLEKAGDQMAAWLCQPRNLGAVPFMADEWEEAKGQL